jgi:hypothetical protein
LSLLPGELLGGLLPESFDHTCPFGDILAKTVIKGIITKIDGNWGCVGLLANIVLTFIPEKFLFRVAVLNCIHVPRQSNTKRSHRKL